MKPSLSPLLPKEDAREAALFALELGDSATALKLARQNWNDQREPADLRILALTITRGFKHRNAL